jgi:hypothetical protein
LFVFMVYILSRIVNKFFLRSTALAVNEHADLALLGPDHHRLAAHAPHHVERVHRTSPKGELERILLEPLFDRLSQLGGDLKEAVRGTKPPDPLVGPLVVVVLDPDGGALHRLIEAVKLCPLQKLPQQRLPEPLGLSKGHRVVRPGADVFDAVFLQLLLEAGLPPPVGVLPAVVGQHLLGDAVLGYPSAVGLKHVLGGLAAVQPQRGDVAAVIVDEADQVGVVAPQPDGKYVRLPELVRPRPLEETRLGWVLLGFDGGLFQQALRGQGLVNRGRAGAHKEKALQDIADPPGAVLGMRRLHGHRLLPDLLGNATLPGDGPLGFKSLGSMKPKNLHPTLDRMGADPKLLDQQFGAVPFLQVKLYDPQPELQRKSQGPALSLGPACGALGRVRHRVTSSLCKGFLHSEVSPNFLSSERS